MYVCEVYTEAYRTALIIVILTGICVNNLYHGDITAWDVVNLFQPRLEVYVCIAYII